MNIHEVLQFLAQHLSIDPDFTIRLPDNTAFGVSTPIAQRLQTSPRDLQVGFLQDHLQTFLIDRYFSTGGETTKPEDFANDSAGSIHSEFYHSLEQANPSSGYYDWAWIIEDILADGWLGVVKDGLHLQMPDTHLYPPEARAVGDEVAIAMPNNLLTGDRYIAVSDRGRPQNSPIANVYFHIPAATAPLLLAQLAQGLNQAEVLFELALLIDESEYPRRDGAILRLDRSAYGTVETVWRSVARELATTLLPATPLGTQPLAPGIAVAEVTTLEQDFGTLFWGAVARGLVQSWGDQAENSAQRWRSIQAELANLGLRIPRLHCITSDGSALNEAEDIYRPWSPA